MPTIDVNGATLHYEDSGAGSETIVFAHGLLWSGEMFSPQIEALRERYRCITFDFRGQGRSDVTRGGYEMDALAADAVEVIMRLDAAPCHFVGLSMGGFIGLRLAIERPDLLRSLVLLETSADPEPRENVPRYRALNFIARWFGLRLVAGRVMPIMFGRSFLEDPGRRDERARWRERLLNNNRIGISRAVRGVVEREGVADRLGSIRTPTLILVGDEDTATVPEKSRRMHERIAGSEMTIVRGAGHSSTIEQPAQVTSSIRDFIGRHVATAAPE